MNDARWTPGVTTSPAEQHTAAHLFFQEVTSHLDSTTIYPKRNLFPKPHHPHKLPPIPSSTTQPTNNPQTSFIRISASPPKPNPYNDHINKPLPNKAMNCDSCGAVPEAPHHSCNCSNPDCIPPQTFPHTPFNNPRWLLRRSTLLKPDNTNSTCSDDYRKPEEAPQTSEQTSDCGSFPDARPDTEQNEIDEADLDDLDTRSMEVSAAQSETASTISRAAFSVGDKAEVEVHPPVLTTAQPAEERRKPLPSDTRPGRRAHLRAAYVRELLLSSLSL